MNASEFRTALRAIGATEDGSGRFKSRNGALLGTYSSQKDDFTTREGRIHDLADIMSVESKGDSAMVLIKRHGVRALIEGEAPLDLEALEATADYPPYDPEAVEPLPILARPVLLSEVVDIFPVLFPNYAEQLYYDELNEVYMIDTAMLSPTAKGGFVQLDDSVLRRYRVRFENRLSACGYVYGSKRSPVDSVKDDALLYHMDMFHRNPFRDWVESHEWDGMPRMRTWFQDTFGAYCPPLASKDDEALYLGDVSQAWFLGGIARMYAPYQMDVVPVFMGLQGAGKGHALAYTAGINGVYASTTVDMTAKGGKQEFLESIRGKVVVDLGEGTQFATADAGKLKDFITQPSDIYRKPYDRAAKEYPRHFILSSSVNYTDVFTDVTGNRRFLPILCKPEYQVRPFSIHDRGLGQYDVEQVWAEALHVYRNDEDGEAGRLSEDVERRLAPLMQEYCTVEDSGINAIDDWLDDPMHGYSERGAFVSKPIIMEECFGDPPGCYTRDHEEMYKRWCKNGASKWVKDGTPRRIGKRKLARAYRRVRAPGEVAVKHQFIMKGFSTADNILQAQAVSAIRRVCRYQSYSPGDLIDLSSVEDSNVLEYILANEYAVDCGDGTYRLVTLP